MTRTNAFTMLCVLIRAGAALFFASTMVQLVGVLASDVGRHWESWSDSNAIAAFGVPVFVAILFWFFPDWLARVALARKTGEVFESDLDATAWQAIVNAGVGLYFIGEGLAWAPRQLILLFMHARGATPLPDGFGPGVAVTVTKLFVGVVLLLGARALALWLERIRGLPAPAATEETP